MNKLVSVSVCTNRPHCLPNIINNYKRQSYKNKELIVIINSDAINRDDTIKSIRNANITKYKVVKVSEKKGLGYCLNIAIARSSGVYWTKMDDDDFYDVGYLKEVISYLVQNKNIQVVGKCKFKIYIPEHDKLYMWDSRFRENSIGGAVAGATITVRRSIFRTIRFNEFLQTSEDSRFLKICKQKKYKIYATSSDNFIVIRHIDPNNHTWKIKIKDFQKRCKPYGGEKGKALLKHLKQNHIFSKPVDSDCSDNECIVDGG